MQKMQTCERFAAFTHYHFVIVKITPCHRKLRYTPLKYFHIISKAKLFQIKSICCTTLA